MRRSHLSLLTVFVLLFAWGAAADLPDGAEEPAAECLGALAEEETGGQTLVPEEELFPERNVRWKETCWEESRWVKECCPVAWGQAYGERLQTRLCCEHTGCRSWQNTSTKNCWNNFPC